MKSKETYILLVVSFILLLTGYNAFDDLFEDTRDENFYENVTMFMNRGDRNTAAMGYSLCKNQNRNSIALGLPVQDCCTLYFRSEKQCDILNKYFKLTDETGL